MSGMADDEGWIKFPRALPAMPNDLGTLPFNAIGCCQLARSRISVVASVVLVHDNYN